ncbi:ATP synthase subunit d, mitochondrial, partial [Armadillidium nasatum]
VVALPESLPKIHWDQYKTRIAVPGMVDEFQKQYEALNVPYPANTYLEAINAKEKQVMSDVKEFCRQSDIRIASHKEELKRWENMVPLTEMTLEEFAEEFPEHAINLEKPTFWPHNPESQIGYVPEGGEEDKGGH